MAVPHGPAPALRGDHGLPGRRRRADLPLAGGGAGLEPRQPQRRPADRRASRRRAARARLRRRAAVSWRRVLLQRRGGRGGVVARCNRITRERNERHRNDRR